mmetsp:Transcript_20686/g.30458  ORF Transcript_20686/g.30458 Transcript_20686/m.30458 type:complete len:370 (+) Transcript_20686:134-1243(+)
MTKERKRRKLPSKEDSSSTDKSGGGQMSSTDNILDSAAHLHNLLQSKENELKEREADFNRRVKLFETEHPTLGGENDVIQLNVGGKTNIAVLRSTLTQFEDSMLAAKFSGRWDDSLEKDRDGNTFIDQDPEIFLKLINYLRLRMNNHFGQVPERHLPKRTYSFCTMLEYYNLMPALYPQNWTQKWVDNSNGFTCEEVSYGTVTLSSKGGDDSDTMGLASVLHDSDGFKDAGVSEFTVEFEKGTSGSVGWLDHCSDEGDGEISRSMLSEVVENSIFLNITERKIFGPDSILEENMSIKNKKSATKVICRHDGLRKYSIEVLDIISTTGGVAATLSHESPRSAYSENAIFPMISFSGKVTVSGLKYAIDQL